MELIEFSGILQNGKLVVSHNPETKYRFDSHKTHDVTPSEIKQPTGPLKHDFLS